MQQLESDIESRQAQADAEIAVLREKRAKSMIDVSRENARIAQCKVLSPITGLVSIRQNRGSFFGSFGQQVPDIREGDTLQPGAQVADVLDLSELEVVAKIGELDRANLNEGQLVNINLDAIPDKVFHGKIKSMSGTATSNPFGGDPGKKFDVLFSVDMKELMTGLGATPDQIRKVMETAASNAKKAPAASEAHELLVGTPIRVIREPYFGRLGLVTELPAQLVVLESGTEVRVLRAKLDDSEEVTVPRANVEIMAT